MKYTFENNQIKLFENEKEIGYVSLGKQSQTIYRVLRVFVDEEKRGQGVAGELMKQTVSYAQENNLKLIPVCSYAVVFFKRHKEYENVLFKK